MKLVLLATAAALLASGTAMAANNAAAKGEASELAGVHLARMTMGYSYFNRAGATAATHDDDVKACVAKATWTRSYDEVINTGAAPGVAGKMIAGLLISAAWRGTVGAGLENCMVVRGWRVVQVTETEGKAIAALPQGEVAAKLAPWIGAEAPYGEIVRSWANDAANAAIPRFAIRPDHTNDGSLSLKAAMDKTLRDLEPPERDAIPPIQLDKTWPSKPLKPGEISALTPEAAVLIVRTSGGSLKSGIGVTFIRPGPDEATFAFSVDHRPDQIFFGAGLLFAKKEGNWAAIPITPGKWRIAALGVGPVLGLCLGSPSFEAKAGDVIYAGSFDLGATHLGPDLDLAPVKAFLAGQPAAASVKAAAYVNGSTSRCTDSSMYALEVSGAPFEPGYAYGGALKTVVAAPAPTAATAP